MADGPDWQLVCAEAVQRARRAPSPRVWGEGGDEGAPPHTRGCSDSRRRPLTPTLSPLFGRETSRTGVRRHRRHFFRPVQLDLSVGCCGFWACGVVGIALAMSTNP